MVKHVEASWATLAANLNYDEHPMFKIQDLLVDEKYHLSITAFSDSGSQSAFFDIQRSSHKISIIELPYINLSGIYHNDKMVYFFPQPNRDRITTSNQRHKQTRQMSVTKR